MYKTRLLRNLETVFAKTGLAIIVTVTTSVAAFGTFIISDGLSELTN